MLRGAYLYTYVSAVLLVLTAGVSIETIESPTNSYCPGSPWSIHAKCSLTAEFDNQCFVVLDEMYARLTGQEGWVDPHHGGTYNLIQNTSEVLEGTRITGDRKYMDKFKFTFEKKNDACIVHSCSESQVFSICDYDTNYCNLRNLYCSAEPGSKVVHNKLVLLKEVLGSCAFHEAKTCKSIHPFRQSQA
jgi:hypothetical protein